MASAMENVIDSGSYSFPGKEQEILALWDELDAFKEQLRRTEGQPEYVFFDGPPFATGLPHYGHILAGTLKVGWPCMGLAAGVGAEAPSRMHALGCGRRKRASIACRLCCLHGVCMLLLPLLLDVICIC